MLETDFLAGIAEVEGFVTAAIVGHDAGNGDTEAFVISHCCLKERNGAFRFLIRQDLGEGDAGVIVNTNVDELPANAPAIALTGAIAGDAVADFVEATELFDVDMDHLARRFALIAVHRLGRLQVAYPVQSQPAQDPAHGGRRYLEFGRDLLAGVALPPQRLHHRARGRLCLAWQ